MLILAKNQIETLNAYAAVLRIPTELSAPIVNHFIDCLKSSGPEWTISRYKAVKLDFIRLKSGQDCCSTWVAKRGPNRFSGCFGGLQTWSNKNWKNWSRAINLLQMYTTLISSEPTISQKSKFLDAVGHSNPNNESIEHYNILLKGAVSDWFKPMYYRDPEPFLSKTLSSTRREPHASGSSFVEGDNPLECAYSFLHRTSFGVRAVKRYPNLFRPALSHIHLEINRKPARDNGRWLRASQPLFPDTVGKIGLIQEPGFKLRAVANPARIYQHVLKPLGDAIYSKLSQLPWDCTFDQERPFKVLQKHLCQGKTAHAVDLSNATDRFPLLFQETVLDYLFIRKDAVSLFKELSRAQWNCTISDSGFLKWETGQPLGLYPSFGIFAMTHGMILYMLNGNKHNDAFFVLGDDVVILCDVLHEKYERFLRNTGVPFSPLKTISSSKLTEFGGKIITSDGVIPQLKWSKVSDDSFLDLARNFGEQFRLLMKPRQKKIFDMVKYVPDFLGGCGFNPHGIPLEERVRLYYELQSDDNKQSYMLSYNGRLAAYNYAVDTQAPGYFIYKNNPMCDFEQKSALFARNSMSPHFSKYIRRSMYDETWKHVCGNPLYVMHPRERAFPIAGTSIRTSMLDVMERKLEATPYLRNIVSRTSSNVNNKT